MTAQPATQTQTGRTCGECASGVFQGTAAGDLKFLAIILCPLHREAKALLEALEWALPWMATVPLLGDDQALRDRFASKLVGAEATLAAAKGGAG